MAEQSFAIWLNHEVLTAQNALLAMYEKLDSLRFIERPQLEREYMEKIGTSEAEVIREEIECEVLEKKQQIVQTAINRREEIDEKALEDQVDQYRKRLLQEAETGESGTANAVMVNIDGMPAEYAILSDQETHELQDIYHEIIREFHPQTHPELTATQKELFEKAQWAYRQRDLDALKLTEEILTAADDEAGLSIQFEFSLSLGNAEETLIEISPDYSLAAKLFPAFQPTEKEIVMQEEILRCQNVSKMIADQIEAARKSFPFTAKEMLADSKQIQEYLAELNLRRQNADAERKKRETAIQNMLKR